MLIAAPAEDPRRNVAESRSSRMDSRMGPWFRAAIRPADFILYLTL